MTRNRRIPSGLCLELHKSLVIQNFPINSECISKKHAKLSLRTFTNRRPIKLSKGNPLILTLSLFEGRGEGRKEGGEDTKGHPRITSIAVQGQTIHTWPDRASHYFVSGEDDIKPAIQYWSEKPQNSRVTIPAHCTETCLRQRRLLNVS
jgi:hypothetical protein